MNPRLVGALCLLLLTGCLVQTTEDAWDEATRSADESVVDGPPPAEAGEGSAEIAVVTGSGQSGSVPTDKVDLICPATFIEELGWLVACSHIQTAGPENLYYFDKEQLVYPELVPAEQARPLLSTPPAPGETFYFFLSGTPFVEGKVYGRVTFNRAPLVLLIHPAY